MKLVNEEDLTVLRCHHCSAGREWCAHCQNIRSIFWVNGRSFPYSPEGEKRARAAITPCHPKGET